MIRLSESPLLGEKEIISGNLVRQVKDETMDVEALDRGSLDAASMPPPPPFKKGKRMKKLISLLFVCLLTVTVYLTNGTEMKGDSVYRILDNGVIIEQGTDRVYIPNHMIRYMRFLPGDYFR